MQQSPIGWRSYRLTPVDPDQADIVDVHEFVVNGSRGAYFDLTAQYRQHEEWGIRLANRVSAQLRAALGEEEIRKIQDSSLYRSAPEGPHFVYGENRTLFSGRQGSGPLVIAWDTNLLIDYFNFGSALWRGGHLPSSLTESHYTELECLQLVFGLWVFRDIHFVVLPQSIDDAKKRLSLERRAARMRAFQQFTSALSLVGYDNEMANVPADEGLLILPETLLQEALNEIPNGFDRSLVQSAVRHGAHVFLTCDHGVLKGRSAMRPFGLLLATPGDILEQLFACGAYHCLLAPGFAYWPLPDQQRVGHLIEALPIDGRP